MKTTPAIWFGIVLRLSLNGPDCVRPYGPHPLQGCRVGTQPRPAGGAWPVLRLRKALLEPIDPCPQGRQLLAE